MMGVKAAAPALILSVLAYHLDMMTDARAGERS